MRRLARLLALIVTLGLVPHAEALAQSPVSSYVIDAVAQPAPPETTFLKLGTHTSPSGHTISANSRYLLRDGKPWLPVMGEFHYSRYPESEWEKELLKLKAGGVQIVAKFKTPQEWCDWYGVQVVDGHAIVFKGVRDDFTGACRPSALDIGAFQH